MTKKLNDTEKNFQETLVLGTIRNGGSRDT